MRFEDIHGFGYEYRVRAGKGWRTIRYIDPCTKKDRLEMQEYDNKVREKLESGKMKKVKVYF